MVRYKLISGKEDDEISEKIVKDQLRFPINIPYSKAAVNLLKGLLEKNPQLRIELNSNLIAEWLEDKTELSYKTNKLKKSDIINEKNSFNKENQSKDQEQDKTNSNKELFENVIDLDIIIRDPAKFEIKEDDSQKNKYYSTYDFNKKSIKTDKRNSIIPSPDKEREKKRYSTMKPTFTISDKYKK